MLVAGWLAYETLSNSGGKVFTIPETPSSAGHQRGAMADAGSTSANAPAKRVAPDLAADGPEEELPANLPTMNREAALPKPAIATVAANTIPAPALMPQWVEFQKRGVFALDGLKFGVRYFSDAWVLAGQDFSLQPDPGYPKVDDDSTTMAGTYSTETGTFEFTQVMQAVGRSVHYETSMTSVAPMKTKVLALEASLPLKLYAGQKVVVDGRDLELPATYAGNFILINAPSITKVLIATRSGTLTIEGPMALYMHDDRQYGQAGFTLRVNFRPFEGDIKDAKLKLTFRFRPSQPVVEQTKRL
jgi:hypothetical protein